MQPRSTPPEDPSAPPEQAAGDAPQQDRREPDDSPQRRLVQTVQAYEVDPPPPARVRILVAARALAAGTLMKDDDFVEREVIGANMPEGAIQMSEEVRGEMRGALLRRYLDAGEAPRRSGGRLEQLGQASGIPARLATIAYELRDQLMVTYGRAQSAKPAEKIEVSVKRRGMRVRAPKQGS